MGDYRSFMVAEDIKEFDRVFSLPWSDAWPAIRQIWERADAVYTGYTGPASGTRYPLPCAVAREVTTRFNESVRVLKEALRDRSPTIAAYAFLSLQEPTAHGSSDMAPEALSRNDTITLHTGCLRGDMSLSEFFAGTQTRAQSVEEYKHAEKYWAGKGRQCPKCNETFSSVQNLGKCPQCRHEFRASDVSDEHLGGGSGVS